MTVHKAFNGITPERTGYESLGVNYKRHIGAAAIGRVPYLAPGGVGTETAAAILPLADGERLTKRRRLEVLRAAAKLAGDDQAAKLEAASDAAVEQAAELHVHREAGVELSQYDGCAESHKALEREVTVITDSFMRTVDVERLAVL